MLRRTIANSHISFAVFSELGEIHAS